VKTRVAAIDIGTNTVLLLIAERGENGELVPVVDRAQITRLGQGVDRSRELLPEAVERTLACLRDYAAEIAKSGVGALDVAGTSAMRDAKSSTFIERAQEILGVAPRVISGEEEASLSFSGGLLGLGLAGRVTAFDVGGGSTEIMEGIAGSMGNVKIERRKSVDVGSVRLFERHVGSDPPSASEMSLVTAFATDQLRAIPSPPALQPLLGMAGTVTTIAAIARGVQPYDPARIHGLRLTANEIAETGRRLSSMTLDERKHVTGLEPKRADVIPVGAAIVEAVLRWAGASELIVSDRGLRWGLALGLARSLPEPVP
jgi:exopolyphosphatase / guanosine-5'-triphosphate,3'-diphosphate pyrophosphatase